MHLASRCLFPSFAMTTVCACTLVALGCNGEAERGDGGLFDGGAPGATGGGGDGDDGDGGGDDGDGGGDDGTGDGDDGGIKYDVGGGSGGPGDSPTGCEKVDFVFVIDNSGSMEDEQNNLIQSFPGFMETIQSTLQGQDHHIMAVDTDGLFGDQGVQQWPCSPDPDCCIDGCTQYPAGVCNGHPCFEWTECDKAIGGGRVSTPLNEPCDIQGGNRYMIDGQPDLTGTFECMARVGMNGDGMEVQMEALLTALGPLNAPGECNEGFVRDDAVLVIVLITDEEDDPTDQGIDYDENSPGDPAQWKQTVVEIKNGDANAVVVLGLVGDPDLPGGLCQPLQGTSPVGAEASPRLRQFVELFGGHGIWASVCSPDYGPFFEQAVALIDEACDEFVPPG